jgi:hypothetical protein
MSKHLTQGELGWDIEPNKEEIANYTQPEGSEDLAKPISPNLNAEPAPNLNTESVPNLNTEPAPPQPSRIKRTFKSIDNFTKRMSSTFKNVRSANPTRQEPASTEKKPYEKNMNGLTIANMIYDAAMQDDMEKVREIGDFWRAKWLYFIAGEIKLDVPKEKVRFNDSDESVPVNYNMFPLIFALAMKNKGEAAAYIVSLIKDSNKSNEVLSRVLRSRVTLTSRIGYAMGLNRPTKLGSELSETIEDYYKYMDSDQRSILEKVVAAIRNKYVKEKARRDEKLYEAYENWRSRPDPTPEPDYSFTGNSRPSWLTSGGRKSRNAKKSRSRRIKKTRKSRK